MYTNLITFNKRSKNNYIVISINCITYCNYQCVYCYNQHERNKSLKKYIDFDQLIIFLITTKSFHNLDVFIEIFGGEPTLHPILLDFCIKLDSFQFVKEIVIYTNLSAHIQLYFKLLQIPKVQLDCTWHSRYNDLKNINFIKTINTLNLIKKHKNKLNCIVMYEHNNTDNSIYIHKLLQRNNIQTILALTDLKNINNTYVFNNEYTKNELVKYAKYSNNIKSSEICTIEINNNINYFSYEKFKLFLYKNNISLHKCKCKAGLNEIYIDVNGNIFKCILDNSIQIGKIFLDWQFPKYDFNICQNYACCFLSETYILNE